ncbi:10586_t:CDS:2 [Cetraspora pellucida]|uniref:ethanolamine kinase n=1 Tax=Cetraspora pellucida TaxID=1433469 RepID=A0A9N9DPV0_9GLOM|nr:10586_t:CDS:2 [Cetraspora pellucida]
MEVNNFCYKDIKFIDHTVVIANLLESSGEVALKLFESWKKEDLELVQFKSGITNKLVKCTNKHFQVTVLIRTYGKKSDVIIDRVMETTNIVSLSKHGLVREVYCRFNNGIVYGYTPGRALSVPDMSNQHICLLIAEHMAVWHKVNISNENESSLFPVLWKWLKEVPRSYADPKTDEKFQKNFKLEELFNELTNLENELVKIGSLVVFCHNDLLSGNIIYDEAINKISFIDLEYGSMNYRSFDLANHFNEFAGFECDYSLYPSKEFQQKWLRHYLCSYKPGATITDEEVNELYREVNKFALASHFYWGVWGLVQAQFSEINFDYIGYAKLRFGEYYNKKEEFLAL